MRVTDRLSLPQRIVVIIALALAFAVIGDYIPSFATTTVHVPGNASERTSAYQSTLTLSVHMGLPGWLQLVIWLILLVAWTLVSIRILRNTGR
ncbi:MAG: hypothetical protein FWE35_15575 [Streptosporangiales bacterium]|jgi:hypothetical protein|nr:hypothetical protein [Streptosporangiales bacterium]